MYTYFMQADWGGPIKIGIARNPLQRHNVIQTGYPYKLLIRGLVEGNCEGELHERFAGWRLRGEWFDAMPALVKQIQRVLTAHGADAFRANTRFCYLLRLKGWAPDGCPIGGKSSARYARVARRGMP